LDNGLFNLASSLLKDYQKGKNMLDNKGFDSWADVYDRSVGLSDDPVSQ
jgi:hypothetical protein